MSSPKEAPDAPKRRNKSTLLAAVPLDAPPAVAPPEKAGGAGKIIASVAVLAILGGVYYSTTLTADDTQTANIAPARANQTQAAPAPAAVTEAAAPSAVAAIEPAAIEVEPAPVVEPAVATTDGNDLDILQPLAGAPACENAIYRDLATLQRASSSGGTWASHQTHVTNLVQNVINCEGTSFDVVGSFDTLNSGDSDLSVLWTASDKHLVLEMIAVDATPTAQTGAGDALFVLR